MADKLKDNQSAGSLLGAASEKKLTPTSAKPFSLGATLLVPRSPAANEIHFVEVDLDDQDPALRLERCMEAVAKANRAYVGSMNSSVAQGLALLTIRKEKLHLFGSSSSEPRSFGEFAQELSKLGIATSTSTLWRATKAAGIYAILRSQGLFVPSNMSSLLAFQDVEASLIPGLWQKLLVQTENNPTESDAIQLVAEHNAEEYSPRESSFQSLKRKIAKAAEALESALKKGDMETVSEAVKGIREICGTKKAEQKKRKPLLITPEADDASANRKNKADVAKDPIEPPSADPSTNMQTDPTPAPEFQSSRQLGRTLVELVGLKMRARHDKSGSQNFPPSDSVLRKMEFKWDGQFLSHQLADGMCEKDARATFEEVCAAVALANLAD